MEDTGDKKISFAALVDIWLSTKRISFIIWQEKKWLAFGLVAVLIILSTTPFLRSGSLGYLINELVKSTGAGFTHNIFLAVAFLIVALSIRPIFNSLQFYLLKLFWFFLEKKFSLLILKKKSEIDVAIHENPKFNDLFQKVRENGTWRIQNFSDRQFFIFQNILEVIISGIVLFIAGKWVLLALIFAAIPDLFVEVKYGKDTWGIFGARAEVRRKFWNLHWHFDSLSNVTELKIFQNAKHFIHLIKGLLDSFHLEQERLEKKKLVWQFVTFLISQTIAIFVVLWLVMRVTGGKMEIGTMTFFLASIAELRISLSSLFSNLGRQYQDGLFVRDVFALLDIKPALKRSNKLIVLSGGKTPEIVFENVSFSYPDAKIPALKNFSIKISAGEKVALVGANGAGKTTFVKLLCRFYDPQFGRILIGGNDLRDIDLESWYSQLGILFQDYSNYHFLVKDSIAIGRTNSESSMDKVRGAAKDSEADSFIEEWEKSYEQMLGKQFTEGVEPSIGQWQKLALARTFYRDPRIFILDEPTSSIDAEAESKIFQKLEKLPNDRTVILISHRFSTVRQASKICVIKDGSRKELGSHKELLELNGIYAKLFSLQARGYR